jgi:hypothetical protein
VRSFSVLDKGLDTFGVYTRKTDVPFLVIIGVGLAIRHRILVGNPGSLVEVSTYPTYSPRLKLRIPSPSREF